MFNAPLIALKILNPRAHHPSSERSHSRILHLVAAASAEKPPLHHARLVVRVALFLFSILFTFGLCIRDRNDDMAYIFIYDFSLRQSIKCVSLMQKAVLQSSQTVRDTRIQAIIAPRDEVLMPATSSTLPKTAWYRDYCNKWVQRRRIYTARRGLCIVFISCWCCAELCGANNEDERWFSGIYIGIFGWAYAVGTMRVLIDRDESQNNTLFISAHLARFDRRSGI